MKQSNHYPPNYEEIKRHFPVESFKPVFAYGDYIYNPHNVEIPPDLELHETVHSVQQKKFADPSYWWTQYCIDPEFRKQEEVEAYATQYNFIRKHIPKAAKEALRDFARTLSSKLYGLDIDVHQAETLIRKYIVPSA